VTGPTTFGLDLEGAILGGFVLAGYIPPEIRALLSVELFPMEERRLQATAMFEANDRLGACDLIAVQEILSRHGAPLDAILDLVQLAERVPSSAHVGAHVRLLRERAVAVHCISQGAEEFLSGQIKPVEWAVEDIWPLRNSGPLAGPEKVGKGWIAGELILSMTTGTSFLDKYEVPRILRVLWWEEEDGRTRLHRRSHQLIAGRRRPSPTSENLRFLVGHGLKIDNEEGLKILRAEIQQFQPDFVVVGNLREVHSRDENRPEMAHVRDAFRTLSRDFGSAFIVLHHFRKSQEGQSKRGSQMLAGSGVWGAWAESWMYVTPGETEDIAILEVGSKDAPGAGRLIVQRRDVTDSEPLAQDEDGGKIWPLILAEIDPKSKSEESRLKVLAAVRDHYKAIDQPVTIKQLEAKTEFSRRTIVARLPELEAAGLVQEVKLHKGTHGYLPCGLKSEG
jgi:hypothetical protein